MVYVETGLLVVPRYNIIGQSRRADPDHVIAVGTHGRSARADSGMNDNMSGPIQDAHHLKSLRSFTLKDAVCFRWWTAEGFG